MTYYDTGLTVSSIAMAVTISSTHTAYPWKDRQAVRQAATDQKPAENLKCREKGNVQAVGTAVPRTPLGKRTALPQIPDLVGT